MGRNESPRKPHSSTGKSGSGDDTSKTPGPEFLIVGRVVRPHGVRGEVKMKIMTAYPERLMDAKTLYIGEAYTAHHVARIRRHPAGMIVLFDGIDDRDAAEALRDEFVYIGMEDAVPLEEGEYYLFQIEGINVVTEDGDTLGTLTGLIETGANDVYVVTDEDGGELLLPAIPDVILNVDVENQVMTVRLMEGLR